MSKEIISKGNDFVIEKVDRAYGGAREELVRIDGESGDVKIKGSAINGAAQVLVAKKALTVAEVRALFTTPIEVIAAPGAGKFIEIVSVHAFLDYGTAAYDSVGAGDNLVLKYTNASGATLTEAIAGVGFADQTADTHKLAQAAAAVVSPVENAKVVAHVLVGNWYAAAGDSPVVLEVLYRVRDFGISG